MQLPIPLGLWPSVPAPTSRQIYGPVLTAEAGLEIFDSAWPIGDIRRYGAPINASQLIDVSGIAQRVINILSYAIVPTMGTTAWRWDDCVVVGTNQTAYCFGRCRRYAAFSASTRPLWALKGDTATFRGAGVASTLLISENAAPNGVFLVGVENTTTEALNMRGPEASGFSIDCVGAKGFAVQSSEGHATGGAVYDGIYSNIRITESVTGIYHNTDANGHCYSNIQMGGISGNPFWFDGTTGGTLPAGRVGDTTISGVFVDGGSGTTGAVMLIRSGLYISVTGLMAEPGGNSRLFDVDSASSDIYIEGEDACALPAVWGTGGVEPSRSGYHFSGNTRSAVMSGPIGSFDVLDSSKYRTVRTRATDTAAALFVAALGTQTFDFDPGGTFPITGQIEVTIVGLVGGLGGQAVTKKFIVMYSMFAGVMSASGVNTVADNTIGFHTANFTCAVTASGVGNNIRITISSADASALQGGISFKAIEGAAVTLIPQF